MIRTEMWSTTVRAYLFLSFTALCFGANTTLAKLAVGEVSPMMVVALRWLLVVGLLVAFNSRTLVRDWPSLKPHMGFLFAMGALGFAAFNGLFYVAAHHTTAINMGIISGMLPVFVLAGALIVYKTPVGKLQWVGGSNAWRSTNTNLARLGCGRVGRIVPIIPRPVNIHQGG